jgi:hypothetical protein
MSERERWIVYPLLFLALGVALRDTMIRPVTDEVRCRRLVVYDVRDRPVAEIAPLEVAVRGSREAAHVGTLRLLDPFGLPVVSVDHEGLDVSGSLNVFGPTNKPVVHLGASESGGVVQVYHHRGDWSLALGQWEKFSGLLVQALGSQVQQVLVDATNPLESLPEQLGVEGLPPEPVEDP